MRRNIHHLYSVVSLLCFGLGIWYASKGMMSPGTEEEFSLFVLASICVLAGLALGNMSSISRLRHEIGKLRQEIDRLRARA